MKGSSCVVCGESPLPHGKHKYCSDGCRLEVKRRSRRKTDPSSLGDRACSECADVFEVTPSRPEKVVCSESCSATRKARLQLQRTGSNWKVGGTEKRCKRCRSTFRAINPQHAYCSEDCLRDVTHERVKSRRSASRWKRVCPKCETNELGSRRRVCDDCLVGSWNADRRFARYGMTQANYAAMLADQQHRCAICRKHESEVPRNLLYVDHCHNQGWVRGLLCHSCNVAIGLFGDSIEILDSAKEYLMHNHSPHRKWADVVEPVQASLWRAS